MTDKADKDAEELLPNAWWARPAVAAKLRERDREIATARRRHSAVHWQRAALRERDSLIATAEALNKSLREALDHQGAEIDRLKAENAAQYIQGLEWAKQKALELRGGYKTCIFIANVIQAEIDRVRKSRRS